MSSEREIGRVIAVDTAQLTIELNSELKALTRATGQGVEEVARINSYVILPVGARRIVAMVTKVFLTEEAELGQGKAFVTLPSARRLMKATMIGTIDGREFGQGISTFPVLDNPVLVASKDDLDVIFGCTQASACSSGPESAELKEPKKPGHCVSIGTSAIFDGYPIQIDPDAFFGKHAAVIGSTGSGKSCTIAAILQSILQDKRVKQTRIVIIDTNGEYHSAFTGDDYRCLYIPSDPSQPSERLVIPYWFMNSEDFVRLYRASPGIQRPVLLDALRAARGARSPSTKAGYVRDVLTRHLLGILDLATSSDKTSLEMRDQITGVREFLKGIAIDGLEDVPTALDKLTAEVAPLVGTGVDKKTEKPYEFNKRITADAEHKIRSLLRPILDKLLQPAARVAGNTLATADSPRYFDKVTFRSQDLPRAMTNEETVGAKAREMCGTMVMRMNQLLDDARFEFLFGPVDGRWPEPAHSLAAFLRDALGMQSLEGDLSKPDAVPERTLPFYDRQRVGVIDPYNVVILDLSLLAAEVLENVTALLGRLILEFLQRASDTHRSDIGRGEFPVVLVLEEAQNYIRQPRRDQDESISRDVYERIAREGRKFGLSLVVASQRPSELSKTVLSQCSTFVVHRLQNPEDLRYFKEIVPGVYEELLEQLPALAAQYALVLGEGVRAPSLMRVRDANPVPRSKDPQFWAAWTADNPRPPNVEKVCADWEGQPLPSKTQDKKDGTEPEQGKT